MTETKAERMARYAPDQLPHGAESFPKTGFGGSPAALVSCGNNPDDPDEAYIVVGFGNGCEETHWVPWALLTEVDREWLGIVMTDPTPADVAKAIKTNKGETTP